MDAAQPHIDWTKNTEDAAREVVREAEAFLTAQVALAVSADQRASSMASIFTAAGAGLIVGLMTLASSDHAAATSSLGIYVGGGIASILFLVAAIFSMSAALPVDFEVPGNVAASWKDDIESGRPLREALGELAETYDEKIASNNTVLADNARRFKRGAQLAISAPALGALAWVLVLLYQHAH